jgi:hypothetical protein
MPDGERHTMATQARLSVEKHDLNEWLQRQISDINALLDRLPARIQTHEVMFNLASASNRGTPVAVG